MKKFLIILVCSFLCLRISATHIVGGEMIYDFLGKNVLTGKDSYRVILRIYKDCGPNVTTDFDGLNGQGAAFLTILSKDGSFSEVHDMGLPVVTQIPSSINSPCVQTPNDACVKEGIYTYTLELEPRAGGYYLVYQRCCRNVTILNLTENQGATYYAHIPGPEDAASNNSPRFNKFPPIFLCGDVNFYFDHSATDPDGDDLVYSLYTPFQGLDNCCPSLGSNPGGFGCTSPPPLCPSAAGLPPYNTVLYTTGYSPTNPMAANPALSIDSVTGKLTGKPNIIGQFVVCICVREYRNGKLLGIHYRDFQFNIKSCIVSVISDMADQLKKCEGSTLTFTNQSVTNVGNLTFKWDFGVPGLTNDTSTLVNPNYSFPDTGGYVITLIGNPYKLCSDTVRKMFYVYPPLNVTFPPSAQQCIKSNSFTFSVTGSHMFSATFRWEFGSAATPSTSTLLTPSGIVFKDPGRYFVKLYGKQLTCIDSFIDSVRILRRPKVQIINPPTSICTPASLSFSATIDSEEPTQSFWTFSNGKSSTETEPLQVFVKPGRYSANLVVTTSKVCKDTTVSSISHVTVQALPVPGFEIKPKVTTIFDPLINLKSNASGDGLSFYYEFGDGVISHLKNPDHVYYEYGNYTVLQIVTNAYGCIDSIRDIVKILPEHRFWAPDAFTPDGDGLNDIFLPCVYGVAFYQFDIFDRWGQVVFSTNDPRQGWNGSREGAPAKQDIYVWKVAYRDVVNYDNYARSGHVTLIKSP